MKLLLFQLFFAFIEKWKPDHLPRGLLRNSHLCNLCVARVSVSACSCVCVCFIYVPEPTYICSNIHKRFDIICDYFKDDVHFD